MRTRSTTWLAWSLWAVVLVIVIVSQILTLLTNSWHYTLFITYATVPMAYATVGTLIAWRRPANTIGWMFVTLGLLISAQAVGYAYAHYARLDAANSLPGVAWATWVSSILFALVYFPLGTFLPLIFPQGRLPSRRWRPVAWLAGVGIVLITVGNALHPDLLDGVLAKGFNLDNPVGIEGAQNTLLTLTLVGFVMTLVSMFLAVALLILRFRQSKAEERQQLKWFVLAAIMLVTGTIFGIFISEQGQGFANLIAMICFPVAIGIAILRYRLYDIDIIINRTLVYGTLTAMLALLYLGSVVVLRQTFAPFLGSDNQIATVASTLAIAALFQPLRRRIQAVIDRRFYRRKYDAQQTLQAFSVRMRDETDVDRLTADLIEVINDTVQPAHVSLWTKSSDNTHADTGGECNTGPILSYLYVLYAAKRVVTP